MSQASFPSLIVPCDKLSFEIPLCELTSMQLGAEDNPKSAPDASIRSIVLTTLALNALLGAISLFVLAIAPRGQWHIVFDFLAAFTVVTAVIIITWRYLIRQAMLPRISRVGSFWERLDTAMSFSALAITPLFVLFLLNSLFRFL